MVKALTSLSFKGGEKPSDSDQEHVAQELAAILEQAAAIGRAHAQDDTAERGVAWSAASRVPLVAAWAIIAMFIERVIDWFNGQDAEDIDDAMVIAFIASLADTVANTEVAATIEQTVLDTLQEQGVLTKSWQAQDGACVECMANAEQGEIPIGDVFLSQDMAPPAHPRCRCSL